MDTVTIMKALADDARLDIVRCLARQRCAMPSCDVTRSCSQTLQLAQPTISHHLAKLVQAGVLHEHKHGKQKFYRLNAEQLLSIGIDPSKL